MTARDYLKEFLINKCFMIAGGCLSTLLQRHNSKTKYCRIGNFRDTKISGIRDFCELLHFNLVNLGLGRRDILGTCPGKLDMPREIRENFLHTNIWSYTVIASVCWKSLTQRKIKRVLLAVAQSRSLPGAPVSCDRVT